ncbi:MAG: TetR/AcrR family transcriptional regulator [Vibrio sp.]
MARKCNFEREEKLHAAMILFWQKGYANTAISDLVGHLQINRFSLYNTFGDKQKLYYAALDRYLSLVSAAAFKQLQHENAAWPELTAFLQDFAALQRHTKSGCFMQNALVEHAGTDTEVLMRGNMLFDHLLHLFRHALGNALRQGQIKSHIPVEPLAQLLLCQIQGMRILGKTQRYNDLEIGLDVLINLIEHQD